MSIRKFLVLGVETVEKYYLIDVPDGEDPKEVAEDKWNVAYLGELWEFDRDISVLGELPAEFSGSLFEAREFLADQWEAGAQKDPREDA